jgi:hypothetical protein
MKCFSGSLSRMGYVGVVHAAIISEENFEKERVTAGARLNLLRIGSNFWIL